METFVQTARSKPILYTLCGIIGLIILLGAFQAGQVVGYRKAAFSFRGGDNFYRAFGAPEKGKFLMVRGLDGAHGAAGRVVSIALPNLVIEDMGGTEKPVLVTDQTIIKNSRTNAASTSLVVDDHIIVIGEPDSNARIVAKLIRVVPPPQEAMPAMPLR